jgi:glycosyltransferase involved in cell wall biosynthesis
MRICFVTLDFSPFRSSGLAIYAERIVEGLAARGHSITVIASHRPGYIQADNKQLPTNVSIIRLPIGRLEWIGLGWQVARYLRSIKANFDVIHFADVHFAYAYHGAFVASAFQSFRQRLTSYNGRPYHTNSFDYLFRLIYYNVARQMMEQPTVCRAIHIVMSSIATQQEFIKHYNLDPKKTTVIYPGIDLHRFDKLPSKDEARQRLGLSTDIPILLCVGFLTPRKGVEYLAQALMRMKTLAHLVIVGKWEAGYQRRFLKALGDARSRVLVAGYVSDADLLFYYAAADVFVLPTLLEGFGIPLVEAMASGLPVITTTAGAAGEIVGNAGLVVKPCDSEALAQAIDQVLNDADLAYKLGQAGRYRAHNLFDQHYTALALESLYYRLFNII